MRKVQAIYMALFMVLVDCMSACVSSKIFVEAPAPKSLPTIKEAKQKREFHRQIEATIPLELPSGTAELNADIFRPGQKSKPKTLVIIVPGSGNVSRRGEVSGTGIDTYEAPLEMSLHWAKALADKGFFVLSYDKRSCGSRQNPLCHNNDQRDIDQDGLMALARDLDQAYLFSVGKLRADEDGARIVLLSTTQGAQAVTMSTCAKKVSGIILFSPIIGELDAMWVGGLGRAADLASSITKKNRLLNQKESMAGFFASLKRGDFPENGNIRGASVKFWQSWMEASKNTLPRLVENGRPALLLFSGQDTFSSPSLIADLQKRAKNPGHIRVKSILDSDRNFVGADGVTDAILNDVVAFIEGLPVITP